MNTPKSSADVVILGAGFAGSALAAILARHGVDVLLIDTVGHPRFAIGESTVPETTSLLRAVGVRYQVPELAQLANFDHVKAHVGPSSGVKRHFAFAYHRPGELHKGAETHQFPTLAPPFGPDVHYFRQDVDAWLFHVALRYGAKARIPAKVRAVEPGPDGVRVELESGEALLARVVVDGTGFGSPLARLFGWRRPAEGMRTDSGAVFTHMIGVKPYDRVGPDVSALGLPYAFHEGTMHHVFDGGWMWVIPFCNHPDAVNPLTSVGVCLNNRKGGLGARRPEQVFADVLERFPSLRPQFADARAARPWVASQRMQLRSHRAFGGRCLLLPHAAGFVDPLLSNGLAMTANMLIRLPQRLLTALADDELSQDRFADLDADLQRHVAYYDALVGRMYDAFADFESWDAWFRIWVVNSAYGTSAVQRVMSGALYGGLDALQLFEEAPYKTLQGIDFEPTAALFERAGQEIDRMAAGELPASEARRRILAALGESGLCPAPWALTDPDTRCPTDFTLPKMGRYQRWARTEAPLAVREAYFDLPGSGASFFRLFGRELLGEARRQGGRAWRQVLARLRDAVRARPRVELPEPPRLERPRGAPPPRVEDADPLRGA